MSDNKKAPKHFSQRRDEDLKGTENPTVIKEEGVKVPPHSKGSLEKGSNAAEGRYEGVATQDSLDTKKKWGKGKIVGIIVLVILLAVLGFAYAYINNINNQISIKDPIEKEELSESLAKPEKTDTKSFYMLVLGSDARPGEATGRADVNILCHIDPQNKVIELISVPRDTAVNLPGHGMQKINAAYAFGGPSLAVDTMTEFAGVPITHYAEVRFTDVVKIIDDLGGVEVNVPESFNEFGTAISAGKQTLNGDQALAFARQRHQVRGGDFSRAQAQRIIMQAVINKVLKAPVSEIPALITRLAGMITTDMDVYQLTGLASDFQDGITMYSAACPSYTFGKNGISYVGTMYDEWKVMMQRVDASLDPKDDKAVIPDDVKDNDKLGAATNGAGPRDYQQRAQHTLTTDDVLPEVH